MKSLFVNLALLSFLSAPTLAQVQSQVNASNGTKNTFSYVIQSTYGVTTQANASPNFVVENEAILKLKQGSFVTNKFGNDDGTANAVFTATPTGGSVDLSGITGKNLLLIDDGTSFRSYMRSVDNPNPDFSVNASASALATHTSSLTVEKGESSFSQTFTNSF